MTEWVLVPREPTAKMVLAAFDAITNASGEGMIRARWRCMLDAAPAAPQMTDEEMDDAIKRDEAEQERAHIAYLRGIDEGKRQAAAPQQAEPVAWMAFGGALVHAVTRNAMDPIEAERFDVPLYLHPPAAEVQRLRDAARAVLQEYSAHGGLRPSSMNPLIIDLHRAMEGKQC